MEEKRLDMKKIAVALAVFASLLMPGYAHADEIPALISVSPTSGDIDGGNTVTLTGSGFTEATRIRVGSSFVADTFVSSTQITIVMPANAAGFVNIAAFAGSSGAVLTNAYEYIDTPDPEPTPEPTPEPEADPEPEPEPTPTSTPVSAPAPSPVSTSVVAAAASTPVAVVAPEPTTSQPIVEESPQPTAVQEEYPIYRYTNNVTVYTNDTQMNVVVTNVFHKRLRYTLQKMTKKSWTTVAVAYRKGVEVTFYGVPMQGGVYRIVNASKPIKWFSVPIVIKV
jgi:hypothetical protein